MSSSYTAKGGVTVDGGIAPPDNILTWVMDESDMTWIIWAWEKDNWMFQENPITYNMDEVD
jgi:hypothetical protein